jgi:hypothetical protein
MLKLLKYNKLSFKYYLDVYIFYLKVPDITYCYLIKRGRGTGPMTPGNRYFNSMVPNPTERESSER